MSAPLETSLIALGTVFAAEMGDKSQLLAVVLATRFRQPVAVIAGMGTGLLLNHMLAAAVGVLLGQLIPADILRIVVAAGFFLAAGFVLFGGNGRDEPVQAPATWRGAYLTTAATFFVVEMGDRTQLLVASMAAATGQPAAVLAGAFVGIMLAAVPAVLFADRLLTRLPVRLLRWLSAAIFVAVGLWVLFD